MMKMSGKKSIAVVLGIDILLAPVISPHLNRPSLVIIFVSAQGESV